MKKFKRTQLALLGMGCLVLMAVGTKVFYDTIIVGKLNNVFYIDGTKYPKTDAGVKSALADAVTQGGGRVVIPDATAITKTSQWTVGNDTTKQPVELEIGTAANIIENTTGGVDGFLVCDGSGVIGHGGLGEANGGGPNDSSRISLTATTNINALIAPCNRTGTQEGFYLKDFLVNGNALATIASAIFDVQGVFVNTHLDNLNTQTIPGKILRVRAGSSVLKIASDLVFYNDNFDGTGAAGAIPCSIEGAAASEVANIIFFGGGCQHAGAGNPVVSVNGNGVANGAHHVAFFHTHIETSASPGATTVVLTDTNHILFVNCRVSGPVATNIFTISQTGGGLTHDIQLQQLQTTTTPTNLVNNTIDGTTIPSATFGIDLLNYQYSGISATSGVYTLSSSKAYVAAGDLTAGGIHLVPINTAVGQMAAITSAAAAGGTYAGGLPPVNAESGIYFEGAAPGTRIHFATTNSFVTGAIFAWQISEIGNLIAERKGTTLTMLGGTSGSSVIQPPTTGGATNTLPTSAGTFTVTVASGTATMTTAAITGPNCGTTVTVAATGVLTTDTIIATDNAAPAATTNGPLTIKAWPTANNVNLAYCTPSGTITPAAATLNWRVVR